MWEDMRSAAIELAAKTRRVARADRAFAWSSGDVGALPLLAYYECITRLRATPECRGADIT